MTSGNTSHGAEHTSRAKDSSIVDESQKAPNLLVSLPRIIAGSLVVLFIVFWIRGCGSDDKETTQGPTVTEQITAPATKVLIPRFDGFTPIEFPINWPFEIETEGCPIVVHFPGVPEPVHYSGRGSMPTPERTSGITEIASGLNKQVRVRIREVKYIH